MIDTKRQADRDAILNHIDQIFQAFIEKDREAIRRNHTDDWVGFQVPSTKIERGIDAYMKNADSSLQHLQGTGYQLFDTEIQFYGDLALVYYVAEYRYLNHDGHQGSLPLRSIDVYRREGAGWNQAGSNITVIPSTANWGAGNGGKAQNGNQTQANRHRPHRGLSQLEKDQLLRVREAFWHAWYANDRERLGKLLPEDLIAINPGIDEWSGRDSTIADAAKFAKSGAKLASLTFTETRFQEFGDVVILYSLYCMVVENGDKQETTSGRATETFVRRNGTWFNAGWHLDSGG